MKFDDEDVFGIDHLTVEPRDMDEAFTGRRSSSYFASDDYDLEPEYGSVDTEVFDYLESLEDG